MHIEKTPYQQPISPMQQSQPTSKANPQLSTDVRVGKNDVAPIVDINSQVINNLKSLNLKEGEERTFMHEDILYTAKCDSDGIKFDTYEFEFGDVLGRNSYRHEILLDKKGDVHFTTYPGASYSPVKSLRQTKPPEKLMNALTVLAD